MFGGQSLTLVDRASHLGHILRSDLSDTDDILRVQTDICRKANCLLSTFSATNPAVKTLLFHTFCLSLYGSSLWSLAHHLVCILWKLPSIICWGKFGSFLVITILISFTVLAVSKVCKMLLYNTQRCCVLDLELLVFHWSVTSSQIEAPRLSYTSFDFNVLNQKKFKRTCNDEAIACANFICDVQQDTTSRNLLHIN